MKLYFILNKSDNSINGWEKLQYNAKNIIKKITPLELLSSIGPDNLALTSIKVICNYFNINNAQIYLHILDLS